MSSFAERVTARIERLDTRVCLGVDPRPERHPATHPGAHDHDPARVARAVVEYFRAILEPTAELVACVKLQSAFFERMGISGLIAMAQLLADAKNLGIPVILDAKRGDIGDTAAAYADAYLGDGVFGADALTVNPYLGRDALEPFAAAAASTGRCIFVLVKTSNPGSADLQDAPLRDGEPTLWQRTAGLVAALAEAHGSGEAYGPIGAVVGGTHPRDLAIARERLPRSLLLVPGYGAQGATARDLVGAFDASGTGAVINASRSLTYASTKPSFGQAATRATTEMRDAINRALANASTAGQDDPAIAG